MRRRIMPTALVLLAMIADTSMVPFLIQGPHVVSLTFVTVIAIAIYLGRMHGMLYGMIGGLLLDITVGYPLGFNTFLYIALGFAAGTIAYEPESEQRTRQAGYRLYARRALTFFGAALVAEVIIFGYQYFNTALIAGIYFLNILIRTALFTALGMLLGPLDAYLILGRPKKYQRVSPKREVKSF